MEGVELQLQRAIKALSKVMGKPSTDISKSLEDEDTADTLIEDIKKVSANQFNEGQKKVKGMLKKSLKKEGLEVDDNDDMSDILEKLKTHYTPVPSDTTTTQDEKDTQITSLKKELDTVKTEKATREIEHKNEIKASQDTITKEVQSLKIEQIALNALSELNAVIPEDKGQFERKKARLLNELKSNNYRFDEKTGDYILQDKNGDDARDDSQMPITLKSKLPETVGDFFTIQTIDSKGSAGLPKNKEQGKSSTIFEFKNFKGVPPKTLAEYNSMLTNPMIRPDERMEILEYKQTVTLE